jgi:hypothetical protein
MVVRPRITRGALPAAWSVWALLSFVPLATEAHPHDEPEILTLEGTLTKVDAVNRAIELDAIDPDSRTRRNMLFLVERKAKILNGKTRVELQALQAGQRVTCVIERQFLEGREDRVTVFEIRAVPGA